MAVCRTDVLGDFVQLNWKLSTEGGPASDIGAEAPGSPASLLLADDAALVRACIGGRLDAFDVIVERHRRAVYQVCYRFLNGHDDAHDLVQEVFIRAYKGLRNFRGHSSLTTWLYRIAVNACLNRISTKGPATEDIEPERHVDLRSVSPVESLLREERAERVRAAIVRLPPKQRATLILRTYHELPHEEIASILGSSVGAAKANFCHALQNLRRLLTEEMAEVSASPAGDGHERAK